MTTHSARPLRALAATLAVTAASLLAAAPQASANTCNYDGVSFNACLRFDWAEYGYLRTHVGIDVFMPRQFAQQIVDCGPHFSASLWGDDGANDQFILPLSLKPGWPAAGDSALGAEFGSPRLGPQLDEDPGADQDELYAKITFFDCYRNQRTYYTGTIKGDYRF
jgi:hypothetical protein